MNLSPRARTALFWLIFILNMAGFFYGIFFFYWQQLARTPPHLLLLSPDCPLFALLFALSMLLVRSRMGWDWFKFLTFAGALKYSFWTVFVLTAYPEFYYVTPMGALLSTMLLVAHVGMFFETFLLASLVRVRAWHLLPVLGFLLLNDYSDYFWLTYPPMPQYALPLMLPLTVAATLLFTLAGYWILRNARRPLLPVLRG